MIPKYVFDLHDSLSIIIFSKDFIKQTLKSIKGLTNEPTVFLNELMKDKTNNLGFVLDENSDLTA